MDTSPVLAVGMLGFALLAVIALRIWGKAPLATYDEFSALVRDLVIGAQRLYEEGELTGRYRTVFNEAMSALKATRFAWLAEFVTADSLGILIRRYVREMEGREWRIGEPRIIGGARKEIRVETDVED